MKKDETFVWVVDNAAKTPKRSVWDRIVRPYNADDDDDDSDMPGPNAGATVWTGFSRKSPAAFA